MNSIFNVFGSMYHMTSSGDMKVNPVYPVLFISSILIAVAFACDIKNRIRKQKEFSGCGWGIINGILGIGILWVIIAHNSINKEIAKISNKKYEKYAKDQMKTFITSYAICLALSFACMIAFSLFR